MKKTVRGADWPLTQAMATWSPHDVRTGVVGIHAVESAILDGRILAVSTDMVNTMPLNRFLDWQVHVNNVQQQQLDTLRDAVVDMQKENENLKMRIRQLEMLPDLGATGQIAHAAFIEMCSALEKGFEQRLKLDQAANEKYAEMCQMYDTMSRIQSGKVGPISPIVQLNIEGLHTCEMCHKPSPSCELVQKVTPAGKVSVPLCPECKPDCMEGTPESLYELLPGCVRRLDLEGVAMVGPEEP